MTQVTNSVYKFLWSYFSKHKLFFFLGLVVLVSNELFIRFSMYFTAESIEILSLNLPKEEILSKVSFNLIMATSCVLVMGFIFSSLIYLEAKFLPYLVAKVNKDLFSYAHQHSTAFFNEELAGNVASKVNSISNNIYPIYYNSLYGIFKPVIALLITFIFIININITLAFILLVLMSFTLFVMYNQSKKMAVIGQQVSSAKNIVDGIMVDSIANADLVKSFSNYLFEKRFYFSSVKKLAILDKKETCTYAHMYMIQNILLSVMQIVFFLLPVFYWYQGKLSIADFILIQSLILIVMTTTSGFISRFSELFKLYGRIRNGLELLSKPYDIVDSKGAKTLELKEASIEYKNVAYSYNAAKSLFSDFSLKIESKQKVGLVGYSGAGKSTLIKILLRYYDLQSGEILIDKQNIKNLKQDSLRKQIAVISQETSLFNRTILENIKYGNPLASDDEVFIAAKKAYIHDFIQSLPNGYETKVGDRGIILSGGERQRVAIARAILKNAPILILDEATSALDSQSEKYIQESLKTLMQDKTVIAIAHRLSTLREMDKIIVLDKGKIIESGSHKYLLSKKGKYYNLYSMQSEGFLKNQSD